MQHIIASDVKETLLMLGDNEKVAILSSFFKTGKGQYGEGDKFLGIKVPVTRGVAKEAVELPFEEVRLLLDDEYHEVRVCGFMILVQKFARHKDFQMRKEIVDFYLENARSANNWDLVDLSAPKILGEWLKDKPRAILYKLAESNNVWEQRIAIVTCWTLIRNNDVDDALAISEILLHHPHDLIRKAVGWMLREVGKKDYNALTSFLDRFAHVMPRTSLRYAIERFTPEQRSHYMNMR